MDRKNLLLEEASSGRELTQEEEQKCKKAISDGGIYLEMVKSPGWKKLNEDYISKRISQERYLAADSVDLADVRAEQRALFDLIKWVDGKLNEGAKSFKRLNNSH